MNLCALVCRRICWNVRSQGTTFENGDTCFSLVKIWPERDSASFPRQHACNTHACFTPSVFLLQGQRRDIIKKKCTHIPEHFLPIKPESCRCCCRSVYFLGCDLQPVSSDFKSETSHICLQKLQYRAFQYGLSTEELISVRLVVAKAKADC